MLETVHGRVRRLTQYCFAVDFVISRDLVSDWLTLQLVNRETEKRPVHVSPCDIIIMIIIMSVFLQGLSILNMLNGAEQVQIQKYKTHA